MTYIAICRQYSGTLKTVWLNNCADMWEAVERARYIPQPPLPMPGRPELRKGCEHLHTHVLHEWNRACVRSGMQNDDRIEAVEELKIFTRGRATRNQP